MLLGGFRVEIEQGVEGVGVLGVLVHLSVGLGIGSFVIYNERVPQVQGRSFLVEDRSHVVVWAAGAHQVLSAAWPHNLDLFLLRDVDSGYQVVSCLNVAAAQLFLFTLDIIACRLANVYSEIMRVLALPGSLRGPARPVAVV